MNPPTGLCYTSFISKASWQWMRHRYGIEHAPTLPPGRRGKGFGIVKIYDISMTIREDMQTFNNGENSPAIRCIQDHSAGGVYESEIKLNVHTGTHVDAPLHMLEGGATIESIPLERLVGPARVLDLQHVGDAVRASDLEPFAIQPGEWILLKTRSSFSDSFDFGFPFLTQDGAKFLVNKGINGVGIDALGIERSQDGFPTHKLLFRHGIIILEGLRLGEVPAGTYWMVVAPLKLEMTEAAPARAFLIGT